MPTLQTGASGADRAVADVPGAIAAAKHTNAQVKARELIIVLVNFVFIVVVSFCLSFVVLAFFDSSSLSCHFWPFTDVLRKIFGSLMREVGFDAETSDHADLTDRVLTERNGQECIWIPQTEILNRVVAFYWPRNTIERTGANTAGNKPQVDGENNQPPHSEA